MADATHDLPSDLLTFLREGRQLEFDIQKSEIGPIQLVNAEDLQPTTIEVFPGCQSIVDDPYEELDGLYFVDVYDLIAEAEHYDPEGLFCYITALNCYGCVDSEHGDVITFPGLNWTQLAASPLPYLDAQWDDTSVGSRELPWLYFPFVLAETGKVIEPYGPVCPQHQVPLGRRTLDAMPSLALIRRIAEDDWIEQQSSTFPCPGVPVEGDVFLYCGRCRAAEDEWARQIDKTVVESLDVTPYKDGWVQCPNCSLKFSFRDASVFAHNYHLTCGQKLNIQADS